MRVMTVDPRADVDVRGTAGLETRATLKTGAAARDRQSAQPKRTRLCTVDPFISDKIEVTSKVRTRFKNSRVSRICALKA